MATFLANTNIALKCAEIDQTTKCEVFSRIVGYIRPVDQWNDGKQEEFKERKLFDKMIKD
jgi:hypothetical protein